MYKFTFCVELMVCEAYEVRVIKSIEISETYDKFDKECYFDAYDSAKFHAKTIFADFLDFDIDSEIIQCSLISVDFC